MAEATETAMDSLETRVVLNHHGDSVNFIVGNEKQEVVCSRQVLILLSPVFKAMLTGHFREATSDCPIIPLPDDDWDSLLIVLYIGHLQFNKIPNYLSLKSLTDLAKLCDKYDTIGPVRPFFEKLLKTHKPAKMKSDYKEWLFIAWVFGDEPNYTLAIDQIVAHCIVVDGTPIWGDVENEASIHPGADELILQLREEKVKELAEQLEKKFRELYAKIEKNQDYNMNYNKAYIYELGYMTSKLHQKFRLSPNANFIYEFEILSLTEIIKGLTECVLPIEINPMEKHELRRIYYQNEFSRFLCEAANEMVDLPLQMIRYLKNQARK